MEPCIAETEGDGGGGAGDPGLAYPNNLSLANLVQFLPKPTLVYQPAYPRSTRLRPRWLLWCAPRSAPACPLYNWSQLARVRTDMSRVGELVSQLCSHKSCSSGGG